MNDLTTSYFSIEKSDKQPDGTLMVYGKATDDSVDIDQQICDAAWLDRAMPAWFRSGGNIREQHSSIAAGVAKEYEPKADGHYIMAHIVDPTSVKKVDAGVLRGFSIGIKSPRVVRDTKAANGRIIDGQIVEVSLVDRPANPNCQLVLAKSVDGESSLVQVEELTEIEKHGSHNQSSHGRRGAGGGGAVGGAVSEPAKVSSESKEKIKEVGERARDLQHELKDNNPQDDPTRDRASRKINDARQHIENAHKTDDAKESAGELKKARAKLETAKTSLEDQNYNREAESIHEMQKDLNSLAVFVGRTNKSSDADVEKHGSHNQSSHGRRGGTGGVAGGASNETNADANRVNGSGWSKEDLRALARENFGNSGSRGSLKAGDTLDRIKNAEGVRVKINDNSELRGKKGTVTQSAPSGSFHGVLTDDGKEGYIHGSDLIVVSAEKHAELDIEKHGSHNQSSHGRRGSGGGAGGGTATPKENEDPNKRLARIMNEPKKTRKAIAVKAREKLEKHNEEMRKENTKVQVDKNIPEGPKLDSQQGTDDAQYRLDDANESLYRAYGSNTPKEFARHLDDAGENMREAGNRIYETATNESQISIAENLMQDGKKLQSQAKDFNKATEPDLRKALQSALHLYSLNKSEEATMDQALVELPVEVVADLLKFDAAQYESARNALARLIEVEAKEMGEGSNEIQSIGHLLQSVMHLTAWYEGEEAEGEVMEQETMIERAAKSYKNMKPAKDEPKPDFMKRCKDAGMDDDAAKACWDKYMSADVDAEKSAEISKCLECGCNQPGSDHGLTTTNDFANVAKPSNVTTAEMYAPGETPKSAEGEEPVTATEEEVKAEEPATEETPAVETTEVSADEKSTDVEALVEQVVKSATESLKSEIAELVSAKEAALSKAMSLETELELAKSLAVAGGPSRTARPINVKTTNDLLTKAAIYKAKAHATTDPTLAKGYKSLAEEFLNKANEADNK